VFSAELMGILVNCVPKDDDDRGVCSVYLVVVG